MNVALPPKSLKAGSSVDRASREIAKSRFEILAAERNDEMAMRGRKPKATVIKLVTGNPGKRPLPTGEPAPIGRPTPPVALQDRPLALWRRFISRAWWLTEFDSPKAWLWVHLQSEAESDPAAMTAVRIGQLRALGSELGLDPAARARLGAKPPAKKDAAADYF